MKTVYLVCKAGIATSTMIRVKVEDFLERKGIEAKLLQSRVADLGSEAFTADVILTTVSVPPEIAEKVRVLDGLPLLQGVGEDQVFKDLEDILKGE